MYVTSKKACNHFSVTPSTLRRWADINKIKYKKFGSHRRYYIDTELDENNQCKKNYIYARVSSKKQEEDLQRQIKLLKSAFPSYEVVSDIGSGINFERRGFKRILEEVFECNVGKIAVSYKDRLSRFGYELFEWVFERFGTEIGGVSNQESKSDDHELSEDIIAIISSFTEKYYGRRNYKNKKDKNLSEKESEIII